MDHLSLFDADLAPLIDAAPVVAPSAPAPCGTPVAAPATVPAVPTGPLLLAVDGNSLAHRAFHAYGAIGLGDASGADRSGLYGFLALLTALHDKTNPDGVVVGFDCREASVRKDRHPAYKANRPDKDPALYALLDLLPGLCADLGVEVVTHRAWEADDVIGSAAACAEAAGWRCTVATSDKDAFGLISHATTVLRLRSGLDNAVEMTPRRLRREVGVAPEQYVEFAALRGDTSDNLKGVEGIGPSRAKALLAAYPSVGEAAADPIGCRSVIGPGPGQALIDDLADAATSVFARNVALMTIRRDLPIDLGACERTTSAQTITEALHGWGLGRLSARAAVALAARLDAPPPPDDRDVPVWL
jgi:DNA polymerase-1